MNCDGIYLNYQWTEDHLDRTNDLVKELRRDFRDVYVGLDIFARGTKGVGEFNCSHVTIIFVVIINASKFHTN